MGGQVRKAWGPVAHEEVLKEKVLGGRYACGATDEHCCPCPVRVRVW